MKKITLIVILFISTQSFALLNSDILWSIVNTKCVPNQKNKNIPDPCSEVIFQKNNEQGFVILKDRNGPLQFLLIPTNKVTGIEDPQVLNADAPNYFFEAWNARSFVIQKYNKDISDDDLSLSINSSVGRSQNQLHIHISCIRSDIKYLIQSNMDNFTETWSLFPQGILGHKYYAKIIRGVKLQDNNPFLLLANDFPDAKKNMQNFGLAVVYFKNNFILLADKVDISNNDSAHAEEIQDHNCPQLFPKK